jgi:hypothetical protein
MNAYRVRWHGQGVTAFCAARNRGRARAMAITLFQKTRPGLTAEEVIPNLSANRIRERECPHVTEEGIIRGICRPCLEERACQHSDT